MQSRVHPFWPSFFNLAKVSTIAFTKYPIVWMVICRPSDPVLPVRLERGRVVSERYGVRPKPQRARRLQQLRGARARNILHEGHATESRMYATNPL